MVLLGVRGGTCTLLCLPKPHNTQWLTPTHHTYYTQELSATSLCFMTFGHLIHLYFKSQGRNLWPASFAPRQCPPKNDKFPFSFTSFNNLPTKHEWKGFFLIKKKVLKEKNWLGKRFPIRETHCAMVYTAMWTNDRVPIRNWCAGLFLPLFAPRPNVFWCILVTRWHSHLPRSDLTAFGIGSPWGKRGGGADCYYSCHLLEGFCLFAD